MAVIEPNKCIIEDLEILAFENEEQLNLYTIWHEALVDKRRELNAISDRERSIIRNENAKKTRQLISVVDSKNVKAEQITSKASTKNLARRAPTVAPTISHSRASTQQSAASRQRPTNSHQRTASNHQRSVNNHQRQWPALLPNGLSIVNSSGKQMMKYKLTKLYNKYRGRQLRRNFVNNKQRMAKIEAEISKSYLNPWLAYTALQALRLPETSINSLNTTTMSSSHILTPFAQGPQKPPLHLVYIDPTNIITYSNRINPQQVAEYKQKSHLLPSATSKKSSAASYDVYEIMEVLANSNKTNVTITRNANRPTNGTGSIYSHSVNANTPGIVSTQLHLQARSYRDIMARFYAQEAQRLDEEREAMAKEPSHEDLIRKYLYIDD